MNWYWWVLIGGLWFFGLALMWSLAAIASDADARIAEAIRKIEEDHDGDRYL